MAVDRTEQHIRDAQNAVKGARELPGMVAGLLGNHRAGMNKLLTDKKVYPAGRLEMADAQTTGAIERLRAAEDDLAGVEEDFVQTSEALLRDLRTTEQRRRDEERADRAWNRIKMLLDGGVSPTQVMLRAAENDDRAESDAIQYYLHDYVEAKAGGVYDRGTRARHQEIMDRMASEHATERQRTALQTRAELESVALNVRHTIEQARREVAGEGNPPSAVRDGDGNALPVPADRELAKQNRDLYRRTYAFAGPDAQRSGHDNTMLTGPDPLSARAARMDGGDVARRTS